jgi:hypothetical protein
MQYNTSFALESRNAKTGKIPVSTSTAETCPASCPFAHGGGCYAEGYPLKGRWDEVTTGKRGMPFADFVAKVKALPAGQLWRHNQAGDLPGYGDGIDLEALVALVEANAGRRGFTYTHKPVAPSYTGFATQESINLKAVAYANANGFTVNLSANNLQHADRLMALEVAPVVVVLPASMHAAQNVTTPDGHKVVVCPATYRDDVTCKSCGLCQKQRKVVVGFPAHGNSKNRASVGLLHRRVRYLHIHVARDTQRGTRRSDRSCRDVWRDYAHLAPQ